MIIWRVQFWNDSAEQWDQGWENFHINKSGAQQQAVTHSGNEPLEFTTFILPDEIKGCVTESYKAYGNDGKYYLEAIKIEE